MDPFSSGFVNLLASQGYQSIDLDSSESPRFSSQGSDDASFKERRKWTPKEDLVLISAWLNTSKDPVVGNEQKAGAFWKRIQEYYNSSPQLAGMPPRELSQCKQRWGRLNDHVCKFVGCYNAALKEQRSGQNENDVMKAAHEIFFNDYQVKFSIEHAWRELKNDQKWCSTVSPKDGGKDKGKNVAAAVVEDEVPECRPPGVKAAKRKRSTKEENMLQLKDMLATREKISKQKLLDRLLASTNQLSDIEITLKNKLIAELLG